MPINVPYDISSCTSVLCTAAVLLHTDNV